MEITGTLARIETYFEEWHRKKYASLHQSTAEAINAIRERVDNKDRPILDLANLLSKKLDGDSTQITDIDDISNILSKNEATNNAINFKTINQRLTALDAQNTGLVQQILNKLGTDTTSGSQTIFQRLKSLENTSLSTTNVSNLITEGIQQAFNGNDIQKNDSLNDEKYRVPGIYKCELNATAVTLATDTCPTTKAFNLVVLKTANKGVRQIISTYDSNDLWIRNYYQTYDPQWSAWTKLYGTHNTQSFDMEIEFSSDGSKKVYTLLATEVKNK